MNNTALVCKSLWGSFNSSKQQPAAKAGRNVFPEILAELLPVNYTSFKIHMEIADEIEVNMLFRRFYPPRDVF